jgi:lipopolysaccharide/colanic/teichoic acid biosynthesis glycosyltransferase
VRGRFDLGFEEWVRLDLWYVKNQSLFTDLKLLVQTHWTVVSMRGAY